MHRWVFCRPVPWVAAILVFAITAPVVTQAQDPEFRAMWVSRYEWPDADQVICQNTIDQIFEDLAAANFNAVFFQIRGQADVLYPSPYEVWSPLIGGSDPGWDPLAYAISAAHANGIEFHAYINTHTCWQSDPPSAHTPPPDPNHVYYQHCVASDPAHRDWLHHGNPDNPAQYSESEYVWFAPGVPDYQAYVRKQIMYVVQNYDVDGVHYDRIRTPWSDQPSYDPISVVRFNDSQTNPDGLDITQWTADQITRTVRDIYGEIMSVKPQIKVSAAVYSNPLTAPTDQHQDALAWINGGAMDMVVPMMYFAGGSGSTWDTRLQLWLSGVNERHVIAGHITSQGAASLLEQIALTRTRGAQGNSVFSWSSFDFWTDYSSVYASPATVPAMSWKTASNKGIIVGHVYAPGGAAVADAQIMYPGSGYTALSSGDGFYTFLELPIGTYKLTATHPGYQPSTATNVSISSGGVVVTQDITLGAALPPVIDEVTPDPDTVTAGHEYTRQLSLTQGVADSWALVSGPAEADVDFSGNVYGWTPTVYDVGTPISFTVRATNTAGWDEETWIVNVVAAPDCTRHMITGFEGYTPGEAVLFKLPRYSGSTSGDLETSPNVCEVTDSVAGYNSSQCSVAQWQYLDTDPQRWMRLTTNNGAYVPNPTVALDRPIRVRLRLDEGYLRLAIGIRETDTTADIGDDGGTSGSIEWVGADSAINGAPQGVLVEPMPGVWQTFIFDPLTNPIYPQTGDGVLWTSTGKGVFEQLAFSVVDSVGPFTVYIDDIELLCEPPLFGDFDGDADVDADDFSAFEPCLAGPDVLMPPPGVDPALFDEADSDSDADVDLYDYVSLQREFTGAQ